MYENYSVSDYIKYLWEIWFEYKIEKSQRAKTNDRTEQNTNKKMKNDNNMPDSFSSISQNENMENLWEFRRNFNGSRRLVYREMVDYLIE